MKRIFVLVMAVALMAAESLTAQRYDNVIDRTVAVVGNSVIMLSDVEREAEMWTRYGLGSGEKVRCEVLDSMMRHKLYYTQASLDSLTVNQNMVDAAVEERMNYFLSNFQSEEELEAYFGKSLPDLRSYLREMMIEQNMTQEMQRTITDAVPEVTPKDVRDYYKSIPKEDLPMISTQYRFSQIVLYPDVKKAEMEVRERLLEFRKRILDGYKFSLLATMYSECESSRRGGELGMAPKDVFWPEFSDAAMALKVGQVSPIVQSPDGFHLIQLIAKDKDKFNARHILLKPKYTAEDAQVAFTRLDSIKTAILADSITFEQAAKIYSEDPASRTNGGVVASPQSGSSYFEKEYLKPADYAVLKNMKVGEISRPIESLDNEGRNGNLVYKIVRLDEIIEAHPATYEQDFNRLIDMAQYHKNKAALDEFIKEKQKSTYIVIDPLFEHCDFKRRGWGE